MLSLNKLQHFVTLAHTLNYVRAAEKLNLSQPALSRSIQTIEQLYGVTLFDRSHSGVTLTKIGREILTQAESLLYSSSSLNDFLLKSSKGMIGSVRFGIGPFLLLKIMPHIATEVINKFPAACISVSSGPDIDMRRHLLAGEIDFYVGQYDDVKKNERIAVDHLYDGVSVFFVRPDHPLSKAKRLSPSDLAPYPKISATAWNASLPGKVDRATSTYLRASIEIDDAMAAADVARQTDGILIGRQMEPINIGLEILSMKVDLPPTPVGIITLNDRTLSPLADAVIQVIKHSPTYNQA